MTEQREKEIQQAIVRVMSKFPLDLSKANQSFTFVGLHQMLRDIPRDEFEKALMNMDGVHTLDPEPGHVQIPTSYFK